MNDKESNMFSVIKINQHGEWKCERQKAWADQVKTYNEIHQTNVNKYNN